MKILQAKYKSGLHFLKDLVKDPDHGRLINYSTKIPLEEGDNVILEVLFPALPNRVLLRGSVASLKDATEGEPATAAVTVAPEDQGALAFLIKMASAAQEAEAVTARKHDRIPLEIPVDWSAQGSGDLIISSTDDVGGGGVQIRTLSPPPVGTELTLAFVLDPATGERIDMRGKVVWVRQDQEFQGMGVQFVAAEAEGEEKKRFREVLKKIMESGRVGGT